MKLRVKRHSSILAMGLIVFLLALMWTSFLFQGLPAGDVDDWYRIITVRQTPWVNYTTAFLRPWSLAARWDGQTEESDGIHSKRIVLPIMLKLSQRYFGLAPFAMYFLTKGLFFAGCVAIVFLLLSQVVPLLYAILGAVAFLFVPVHYSHVLWIADTVTQCYFFIFLGIWIFYVILKNIDNRGSSRQFQWLLLALFVTGWIGIKTKEPMLLLALVIWFFSLFRCRTWKLAPMKFLLMNAVMVFVAFQVVPITHLKADSVPSVQFSWDTLLRLLFQNHDCGYENETVSAFFSWQHIFPVSIARTLGFFALWSIVISIALLGWRKWGAKHAGDVRFWSHPIIQICGVWLLAELPFLGMFQPDPRYFSGTMAPIIILIARLIYCSIIGSGVWVRRTLLILWVIALGFNIAESVQNSLSLRIMIGRRMNYFMETARTILGDLRGRKVEDDLDVGRFYSPTSNEDPAFKKIGDHIYYMGLAYNFGNKVTEDAISFESFKNRSRQGYRYYATFRPPFFEEMPGVTLVGTVDGFNRASLLERLLYNKKKKKRPPILKILKCE